MAAEDSINPYLEKSPDLEGLDLGTGAGTSAAAPAGDISASAATVQKRKRRSDAGQSRGVRGGEAERSLLALSQAQFAKLYSPEIWEKALCTPADAMAAITGRQHWQISQKEREALGVTGSIAAQCFAVTDPRWLAASLCLITILDVYGVRIMIDLADRKREREKAKKEQAERGG